MSLTEALWLLPLAACVATTSPGTAPTPSTGDTGPEPTPADVVVVAPEARASAGSFSRSGQDVALLPGGPLLLGAPFATEALGGSLEEMRASFARLALRTPDGLDLDHYLTGSDVRVGIGYGVVGGWNLTGSGGVDVALADWPGDERSTGRWTVVPGPDLGVYTPSSEAADARVFALGDWPTSGRAAPCGDLDGDGFGELCTADGVVFGPLTAGALPHLSWSLPDPRIGLADLDADGHLELLIASGDTVWHLPTPTRAGVVQLDDVAAAVWTFPGTAVTALTAADLDQDGAQELVLGTADAVVLASPGAPGSASTAVTTLPVGADDLAVGDFDGDGALDLAVGGASQVTVWRGPVPAGTLDLADADQRYWGPEHPSDEFGHALDAADTDGDGRAELAIGAPSYGMRTADCAWLPVEDQGVCRHGHVWWLTLPYIAGAP